MSADENEEWMVSQVRQFNRFYTARLGFLRKRHLDGEFSLTEARILYEISVNTALTASAICRSLELNAGYVSRILTSLSRRKLVRQFVPRHDRREKVLSLLAGGEAAVKTLNDKSSLQIRSLLESVGLNDRFALAGLLTRVRVILNQAQSHVGIVRIVRLSRISDEAIQLLHEYYEAVHVVQRDNADAIERMIASPSAGLWLAYLDDNPVGCVVLKELSAVPFAAECKRLYVRSAARGRGIADRLLDAQEEFAIARGLSWIYLDSYDDLQVAIQLYRKRGYEPCERYNNNPQATVFLRKFIGKTSRSL